jgi:hypothetical protein
MIAFSICTRMHEARVAPQLHNSCHHVKRSAAPVVQWRVLCNSSRRAWGARGIPSVVDFPARFHVCFG